MRQKMHIKPRVFIDCETTNAVVNKYVTNNSRPLSLISQNTTNICLTLIFFARTIVDWNSLDNNTLTAGPMGSFKSNIRNAHVIC